MTPAVRARMEAQLIERLKTPVDEPSWGPDWVKRGEKVAAHRHKKPGHCLEAHAVRQAGRWTTRKTTYRSPNGERTDTDIIARNMEKSRQVAHYRPLYVVAIGLALGIALLAMFVDYQIIRGDVWTRALSNEFMVVPAEPAELGRLQEPAGAVRRADRAFHAQDHRRLRPQCADHRRLSSSRW